MYEDESAISKFLFVESVERRKIMNEEMNYEEKNYEDYLVLEDFSLNAVLEQPMYDHAPEAASFFSDRVITFKKGEIITLDENMVPEDTYTDDTISLHWGMLKFSEPVNGGHVKLVSNKEVLPAYLDIRSKLNKRTEELREDEYRVLQAGEYLEAEEVETMEDSVYYLKQYFRKQNFLFTTENELVHLSFRIKMLEKELIADEN